MAPQCEERASAYGSLDLSPKRGNKETSSSLKIFLGLAFTAIALSAAIFSMSVTSTSTASNAVADIYFGDDLDDAEDCVCAGACTPVAGEYFGSCEVTSTDGNCIGFNYEQAELDGGVYKASCMTFAGSNQCADFPCINEGYCVDLVDGYQCVCPFGYDGLNCQNQVNECGSAVCHSAGICTDVEAQYACSCPSGWYGDGYAVDQTTVPFGSILNDGSNTHGWLVRDGTETPGCNDVDDCASNPCFHSGTCSDTGTNSFVCDCDLTPDDTSVPNAKPTERWQGAYCEVDVNECADALHNCHANAQCTNNQGSFSCQCEANWEGDGYDGDKKDWLYGDGYTTETFIGCNDIDDCQIQVPQADGTVDIVSPCLNAGVCSNAGEGTGDFACACTAGWVNKRCQTDVDECTNPVHTGTCVDHAHCENNPGSFDCVCDNGWTGDGLSSCVDADDCEFGPCQNGGTCDDCGTNCYTCECVDGWEGSSCHVDWNECHLGIHTCHDDAACMNTAGSFDCDCRPGYSGDGFQKCSAVNNCWHYDDDPNQVDADLVDYAVVILDANSDVDAAASLAASGGKQIDGADWLDDYVKTDAGDEIVHKCGIYLGGTDEFTSHGTCTDTDITYVCDCDPGWSDSNCDLDIDECGRGTDACHKYADCTNTIGSYECACKNGFEGDGVILCSDIDDCTSGDGRCQYGDCMDMGILDFQCTCAIGWTDRLCDYDLNECTSFTHDCTPESGVCTNTDGSYSCACAPGFVGDGIGLEGCVDVDDCASSPCSNGVCVDNGELSYGCTCDEGWTDTNCDFDVNECYLGTHDCHAEAKCVNTDGGFYCRCVSGFEGDGYTCNDLDDCDPDPCEEIHTAQCVDNGANAYTCECNRVSEGFCGLSCADDCDECALGTHNCHLSGGECWNKNINAGTDKFTCECKTNWYGDGITCSPCTQESDLPVGYSLDGSCSVVDYQIVDDNECDLNPSNCDIQTQQSSICTNTPGSYTCECNAGAGYWGNAYVMGGCTKTYDCPPGTREVSAPTKTSQRVCETLLPDGKYAIQTTVGSVDQCLVHWQEAGKVFPERYSWGGRSTASTENDGGANYKIGADYCDTPVCGVCDYGGQSALENVLAGGEAVWMFKNLADDMWNNQELYIILSKDQNSYGWRCFGFPEPDYSYPTFMAWTYSAEDPNIGKWETDPEKMTGAVGVFPTVDGTGANGPTTYFCGFEQGGVGSNAARAKLLNNGGATWKVHALGCSGSMCQNKKLANQFVLSSAAARFDDTNPAFSDILETDYQCLFFPTHMGGHYNHPNRIPLVGSGDDGIFVGVDNALDAMTCGIELPGTIADTKANREDALVNNQQAVFKMLSLE